MAKKPAKKEPKQTANELVHMSDCRNKHDLAVLLTNREGKKHGISIADMSEVVKCLCELRSEDPHRFNLVLQGIPVETEPGTDGNVVKPKPGGS